MTSNDLKISSNQPVKNEKSKFKSGEKIEINDQYLDEILDNNNIKIKLAMEIISNDQTIRSETVQDLKDFNCQSLTTQAKKGEQLVFMMPAIKKTFNLLGDDLIELSTENDGLKNKMGSYDKKWLEESKAKLLKVTDDEKRANLFMSRMKKQIDKH